MLLSEIKSQIEKANAAPLGESWGLYPRVSYKELPSNLQKMVRDLYSAEQIQAALIINYIKDGLQSDSTNEDSYSAVMRDIPQADHEKIMIATRNNAVYAIEGNPESYEPTLYANHLFDAFEQAIDEYKGKPTRTDNMDGKKRTVFTRCSMQKAGEKNNIVPAGYYQKIPSDEKHQYALTGKVNPNAFIAYLGNDFFETLGIKRDAILTYNDKMEKSIRQYRQSFDRKGLVNPITEVDYPLLAQHFTHALKTAETYDTNTITVYTPQFFKQMGVDSSLAMQEIYKFRDLWGILPQQKKILSVFTLIGIDAENNTMTFACPYFMELFEIIPEQNRIERKTKKGELIDYIKPSWNELCHTNIVREKNIPAVELVYLVTNGLLRRGGDRPDSKTYKSKGRKYKNDSTITYSISFASLIENTVILKDRVAKAKNPTSTIQRAFKGFYKIIDKCTDVHEYFCDFTINGIIPGKTTLDERLIITFTGINGHYKRKN